MLTLRSKAFFLILVYGQPGCFPTSPWRQLVCAQCSSIQHRQIELPIIVSAGNVSGLRFALNLHNQIAAAPLAVQFCPLDWLGSFLLNSLTTDGAELPGRFLLLFIHKAPLIGEPGTAAGGMREILAASLVFAQAPTLGVLALAALNFAR